MKIVTFMISPVQLSNRGISDDGMNQVCSSLDEFIIEHHSNYVTFRRKPVPTLGDYVHGRYRLFVNMEFGKNNLTSSGLVSLLEVFQKHREYLQVKALKLFQNMIEDRGIACLARLLYAQSEAIEELHFFDNRITTEGVLNLLLALALHPDKVYPCVNRHEKCQPVWAKFEGNKISCSATIIEGLVKRIVPSFSICVGDDRSVCGPNRCGKIDGKNKDTSPICHLFTQFYRERKIGPTSPEIVNELETLTDEIATQIRVTYSEVPAADMPPPTSPSIGVASSIAFDQLVDSQASLKPAVCRICSQGLRDPLKSLKCKHRFCRACFLSHKDQVVGPSKNRYPLFPVLFVKSRLRETT